MAYVLAALLLSGPTFLYLFPIIYQAYFKAYAPLDLVPDLSCLQQKFGTYEEVSKIAGHLSGGPSHNSFS